MPQHPRSHAQGNRTRLSPREGEGAGEGLIAGDPAGRWPGVGPDASLTPHDRPRPAPRRGAGLALIALACALATIPVARADTLRTVDGDQVRGKVVGLTESGELQVQGARPVPLDTVWQISRDVRPAQDRPKDAVATVYLLGGGAIHATKLIVDDGRVTFDWLGGKASSLPLEDLRGVRFDFGQGEEAVSETPFVDSLQADRARSDALFIEREGKLLSVDGVLEQVGPDKVRFRFNDESRSIDRSKVFGLTLAMTAQPPDRLGWAGAQLADGSEVWGELTGFDDGKLTLRRVDGATLELPWAKVASVDFKSERLTFMDELAPERQVQRAVVTYPWPMQRRVNVMGQTMQIGQRSYSRGLGVHAESRLTYDLDGRYERFIATIGIDASTAEQGDCVFRVEGDGRTLLSERVRGADGGKVIRVDVRGVERLDLIVEPGENLDIGDRANWANARLIRRAE